MFASICSGHETPRNGSTSRTAAETASAPATTWGWRSPRSSARCSNGLTRRSRVLLTGVTATVPDAGSPFPASDCAPCRLRFAAGSARRRERRHRQRQAHSVAGLTSGARAVSEAAASSILRSGRNSREAAVVRSVGRACGETTVTAIAVTPAAASSRRSCVSSATSCPRRRSR